MIQTLFDFTIQCDIALQHAIQRYLSPEWFFWVFDVSSKKHNVIVLLCVLVPVLLCKNWKKTLFVAAFLTIAVLCSDQTANVLKHSVDRYRPRDVQQSYEETGGPPQAYMTWMRPNSFPSSHAANIMAAGTVLFLCFSFLRVPSIILVLFVCYGRLYLNKHYPLDVLAGCCIGFCYALGAYAVMGLIKRRIASVAFFFDEHKSE